MITGATGFVGSALAANLLTRGHNVIALSRSDPDGTRTRKAIADAASGFDLELSSARLEGLRVIEWDGAHSEAIETSAALAPVTVAWHCAAEMSYSPRSLESSFTTNVHGSSTLYTALAIRASACRRFYFVSTAYVSRPSRSLIRENLARDGLYATPYHASKMTAEFVMKELQPQHRMPVTVYRPTVIVGHEETGWARCNGFGLYMLADVMSAVRHAGLSQVTLDIEPGIHPDLIPISRLVNDAIDLTLRDDAGDAFEVFQCTSGRHLSSVDIASRTGQIFDIEVAYGKPVTAFDERINWALEPRKSFLNQEWQFDRSRLDQALNRTPHPCVVDDAVMTRLLEWYRDHYATGVSSLRLG
ncbi:SDR family oxidoreductase [Burkholderia ubonensis]|uniref:SDR family oxidoreductase n=1 Tax=Burkholderia ubonensis TaxID=101571 RepID=UPI0018DFC911|nr:SDR family oxidoreductase [Burkholderia ubonensis]